MSHADQALRSNLSARRLVDFDGPHGFDFSGVNLGALSKTKQVAGSSAFYGIRQVLPLVEVRVSFELGLLGNADSSVIELGSDPEQDIDAVAQGIVAPSDRGVGGPFGIVLGLKCFRRLSGHLGDYPARQRLEKLIDGPVQLSPVLNGGILLSRRGGDFRFTSGEDVAVGFDHHAGDRATFYSSERFTFNALGPEAAIELRCSPEAA